MYRPFITLGEDGKMRLTLVEEKVQGGGFNETWFLIHEQYIVTVVFATLKFRKENTKDKWLKLTENTVAFKAPWLVDDIAQVKERLTLDQYYKIIETLKGL